MVSPLFQGDLLQSVLTLVFSPAFKITYPNEGDLVNVYNGLITTWSYNSSDSISHALTIQFVPISHMEEIASYTHDDLNITLGSWTIETQFPVADNYYLRFIYANNDWSSGRFKISMSESSKNASDTSSATSSDGPTSLDGPNISDVPTTSESPSTWDRSSTTLLVTEATSTGIGASSLMPVTTRALGDGHTATAATTQASSSSENSDKGLSTGAKAGIGIGCAAAAIIGIVGLWLLYRIKKKRNISPGPQILPDPDSTKQNENSTSGEIFEADGKHEAANMAELPSDAYTRSELPG